jgi:hypothetical protein
MGASPKWSFSAFSMTRIKKGRPATPPQFHKQQTGLFPGQLIITKNVANLEKTYEVSLDELQLRCSIDAITQTLSQMDYLGPADSPETRAQKAALIDLLSLLTPHLNNE